MKKVIWTAGSLLLLLPFSIGAFQAGTTSNFAETKGEGPKMNDASVAKPIFVPPDGNRSADPTGDVRIKVSGAGTGGAVAVLEVRTSPDFSTPVHVHHVENEWFYAIEGEYEVKVGDEIFHLKPGGSVYAPQVNPPRYQ
jgi:mannose-6-phosphate isomerase-like protein (cupin superfamily)